jgi:hypothetical protein
MGCEQREKDSCQDNRCGSEPSLSKDCAAPHPALHATFSPLRGAKGIGRPFSPRSGEKGAGGAGRMRGGATMAALSGAVRLS